MNKETIDIIRVGAIEFEVPVLEFGSGEPRILIVSGIHGDEIESLFAVDRLLSNLEITNGRVDVIPSAHPLAQVFTQRTSPLDGIDLNRNFDRRGARRALSDQTADALMARFETYDFVIDLHTLHNRAPAVCIYIDGGHQTLRDRAKRAIRQFQPDIAWHANLERTPETPRNFDGYLGPWLLAHDIPNIVIEMPRDYHRDDERLHRVRRGIERILADWGVLERPGERTPDENIPMFRRHKRSIDRSGLFEPEAALGDRIESGDVVGSLTSTTTFETQPVRAEREGRVMMLSDRDFVVPGDIILSVGQQTGVL